MHMFKNLHRKRYHLLLIPNLVFWGVGDWGFGLFVCCCFFDSLFFLKLGWIFIIKSWDKASYNGIKARYESGVIGRKPQVYQT